MSNIDYFRDWDKVNEETLDMRFPIDFEEYKGVGGLYEIRPFNSQRFYIGKSNDLFARINKHSQHLRYGRHIRRELQRDVDTNGGAMFIAHGIPDRDDYELLTMEAAYIETFNKKYNGILYNAKIPPIREENRIYFYNLFLEERLAYVENKKHEKERGALFFS